jgi:deoxyribose-phosphate aldolase
MPVVKERIVVPDFRSSPRVDQVGIEERASRFTKRSIKKESKVEGLKLVLSMIDLTTLEGKDTPGQSETTLLQSKTFTRYL